MTRLEMMRVARSAVQVAFSEYLKIRSIGVPVLVFEGKQCPTFYIGRLQAILGEVSVRQVIARGKRNVLELRDLIKRNISTTNDTVLYFVDRDFDATPKAGDYPDVYVTRGYSIENEYLKWSTIERFIRANFDIADSSDEQALVEMKAIYEQSLERYLSASGELHKTVYLCRTTSTRCLPGEDIAAFFRVDWTSMTVSAVYQNVDSLFSILAVEEPERAGLEVQLRSITPFENLEPVMEWRGKFHFSFLRLLLINIAAARVKGTHPFARAARIGVDPNHPSLLSALSVYVVTPPCLESFLKASLVR